ncbi:type VI secretion system-associated protein TagF [Kangiella marina]|uniref:Type VI secretion system-associated protein TagF n=1 Tax=Kangiella marina TaxID=1079178 RepID=A0ABP8IJQ5_9GAMM
MQEYFDSWLQSAINISQKQIGESWLKHYLTSPIWRFIIKHEAMDTDIVGFMMPSIDKVGRYYPLFMLEVFKEGKLSGEDLHCKSFEELEELAVSTLDGAGESSSFFDALNQAGFPLFEERPPVSEILNRLDASERVIEKDVMNYLWQQRESFSSYWFEGDEERHCKGIWWTEGSKSVKPSLIYCCGLPPAEGFSAMLDGDWAHWGWHDNTNKEEEESFAAK